MAFHPLHKAEQGRTDARLSTPFRTRFAALAVVVRLEPFEQIRPIS